MGEKKQLQKKELEITSGKIIVDRFDQEKGKIVLGQDEILTIFLLPKFPHLTKVLNVFLKGEGSRLEVLGALVGRKSETSRIEINIIHQGLSTSSYAHSRSVLFDQSRAYFSGLIKIEKGANKTASLLETRALILGDQAHCESVPSLEIEADDVKASHAATVGKLDETQLFYLQSRGIDVHTATRMLIEGFFEPVLRRVSDEKAAAEIRGEIWTDVLKG
jgi:Fe-S cluster assembly protein SufD